MSADMLIDSKESLQAAALRLGLLPFFRGPVPGLSVEELAAPGILFGDGGDDYGCWDWKGPVIRDQRVAYGKFFRRKAGFVALDLLPHFINFRREAYPVTSGSTEEWILQTIRRHEGLTSADLRRMLCAAGDVPMRRHALEAPLQRLQMGGYLLIADFEYKCSAQGVRYGWGVALYSTPEIWFGDSLHSASCTPQESRDFLIRHMAGILPDVPQQLIRKLIQ